MITCESIQTLDSEMSPPPLKKRKKMLNKTFKNEIKSLEEKISQSYELIITDFKKNMNDLKSGQRIIVSDIKQNNEIMGNTISILKNGNEKSDVFHQTNSETLNEIKSNIKEKLKTPEEDHSKCQLEISNLKQKNENLSNKISEFEITVKVLSTNLGCGPSASESNDLKCKNQMKILMELMNIPEDKQNFFELQEKIKTLQSECIQEKERADDLAANYPMDSRAPTGSG